MGKRVCGYEVRQDGVVVACGHVETEHHDMFAPFCEACLAIPLRGGYNHEFSASDRQAIVVRDGGTT